MGSSSKDSSGGPGAAGKERQASQYAGYCAGLDPVLEAVDELPPSGSPIPPSAQSRVRQFLTQQLSTGTTAAVQALCVRPKDLQDTKQLHEVLQWHVKALQHSGESLQELPIVVAAAQLVADAVRQVARQQVVEKNSTAYGLLLDEGYRAGVMAVGCAGLKAQLGLRITTTAQLARAIAVVVQAVAESVAVGASTVQFRPEVTISFAWEHLKPYHSDSGSSSGSNGSCPWRPSHGDVLSRFVQVTESCMDQQVHDVWGSQACHTLTAAAVNAAFADGPATSVAPNMPSSAAGSSSSGSRGPSAAAAGSKGGAQKSSGSNQGSSASSASALPQLPTGQINMSLPLDDCPLLAENCQLYGPVVAAVAGWPSSSCQELPGGLLAAIKQCVVAQLAAAGSSSERQQAYGGGKRCTIVPNRLPPGFYSLSQLDSLMSIYVTGYHHMAPPLQQVRALPAMVRAVVQEVAQEQAVEQNSAAFTTLLEAGLTAGLVAAGCAALHSELGVRLTTGQQLFEALKASCVLSNTPAAASPGDQRHAILSAYQALHGISAGADSNGSNSSSSRGARSASGSGSGGGSSSSAVPPCGTVKAFALPGFFGASLASMGEWEGNATEAVALGRASWMVPQAQGKSPLIDDCTLQSIVAGYFNVMLSQPESGSGAAGSSSSSSSTGAAAQGQEAESWGKGQGLAGLKGLFASKPAAAAGAAAAPAAHPVTVKASSSTGKGAAAAPAAAAAAAVNKAVAAAGTGSKARKSGSDKGSKSASTTPQPPAVPLDMSLPLDECLLLAERCQLLAPVVAAVASSPPGTAQQESGLLRAAIKQYLAAQLAAGGSSGGQQQADGRGRRLTILPKSWPLSRTSLDDLPTVMSTLLLSYSAVAPGLPEVASPLPQLLHAVVQEVAREQAVEKNSAAFGTLIQAARTAGAVAAGCAALQTELDIVLTTGQQLFEALKASCVALANAIVSAPSIRCSAAFTVYQTLHLITAAADSSSDVNGTSTSTSGGSSSSGKGPAFAMPKCGLDAAFSILEGWQRSLVFPAEHEGDLSVALACAAGSLLTGELPPGPAKPPPATEPLILTNSKSGPGAAGSSSTPAAARGQEAKGRGKGQGLAGLKGLFASKPAAAAGAAIAQASHPVTVKASSSGAVVATRRGAKAAASAAAAAAAVAAKAAAAAPRSSATANATTTGFSTTTTTTTSSSKATDPELLDEANLKSWYCSPATFARSVVVPLPQDSLELLVMLQLHTTYRNHGWNALHYACASHRFELVEQLLAAGGSPSEPEDNTLLQPLHLVCMGRIPDAAQFHKLLEACKGWRTFKDFVAGSGYSCVALARLLLMHGACPNDKAGVLGSELQGVTPLHILSCCNGGENGREVGLVFNNPFVGKGAILGEQALPAPVLLSYAIADLGAASVSGRSVRWPSLVDYGPWGLLSDAEQAAEERACTQEMGWDVDLLFAVLHVGLVCVMLRSRARPDLTAGPVMETPLMIAAARGNAAVTAALLEGGADTELMRADTARALEIAADQGYAVVGWTLLCYGAQALPDWAVEDVVPLIVGSVNIVSPTPSLTHEMLVCNAVQCQQQPWNCFFLQRLLADGAGLEHVWPETGETPLLMAISYADVEMVRILVAAGADVDACLAPEIAHAGDPALAHMLFTVNKDNAESAKQMLQILIDAGADLHSFRNPETGYDLVQTAANLDNMDAALKLVEAGCKWQLPKGQRVLDGFVHYAPEILSINSPTLKLAYVEGRFRLAEKVGRQKRAAIATALQPWLNPDVTPECKDATLRCLVAAGVTPGNPHTRQRPLLTSALSPRVKARWAGVQAQRAAAAAAAGGSAGQQGSGAQPGPRQGSAAVDDIDALLEEIESIGGKEPSAGGAAAAAGSKGAAKKKKKKTVAQRVARQKQLQRARQLQGGGSSSDSEGEGEERSSRDAGGSLSAAGTAEAVAGAAETQIGSGAATPEEQLSEQEAMAAPPDVPSSLQQQTTQQQQQAQQKHDNSQKGKAARKQQQQQARASSSDAAAAPAGEAGAQGPAMQPANQQWTVSPPAAAAAALKAATTGGLQQQSAGLPTAGGGTVQQPQQQGVTLVPQGAPVTPAAAPAAVPAAAPQANPSPVAMRPAAFLPPHLRISMPAAPAAGVAPGVGGAGVPVLPSAVLPMPAQAVPQVVHPVAMQPPPPPPPPPQPAVQQHQQQPQQQRLLQERQQHSALQQRMVELAKQHQLLQQQAAQQGAAAPKQQQQLQPSSSAGSHVPAVPHAMMDMLLSGSAQHTKAAAGRTGHAGHAAAAGSSSATRAAQQLSGAKRQPPAVAAHSAGQATVQAQQHGLMPAAAGKAATSTSAGDAGGGKGPKLCLVCAQRRRNVLLIPCRHLVLCAECAEQLHGRGQLSSCPHCKKPCKQHIRVHQS